MTLNQLRRLTSIWQERLNLRDWTVTARWALLSERDEEWNGTCAPELTYKTAEIVVVHPKYNGGQDIEYVVIHELLHLYLAPFQTPSGSLAEVAEENAVHALASLLVALDRGDETALGRKLSRRAAITR